jgi:hypothetical protein
MTESKLIEAAKRWVIDSYPYNSNHLLNALEWLDRMAPDASQAVRLATLTHDMERAFPGPDQPVAKRLVDIEYHNAHSARSSRIVGEWLLSQGAGPELTSEVQRLIAAHEDGGWPDANLVQAADSVSFLDCNVDLFFGMIRAGKRSVEDVREKLDYTFARIQVPAARENARPMLDRALERLWQLEKERNPAEKK